MRDDPSVEVPADLDVEDRFIGAITYRMAAWFAVAAAGGALVAFAGGFVARAAGVAVIVLGISGGLWQPGGRPATSWTRPLLAYAQRRRGRPPAGDPAPVRERPKRSVRSRMPALRPPRIPMAAWAASVVGALVVAVLMTWRPWASPGSESHFSPPVSPPSPALYPPGPVPPPSPTDDWPGTLDEFDWLDCGC